LSRCDEQRRVQWRNVFKRFARLATSIPPDLLPGLSQRDNHYH
jgi:hypothetical protein